MEIETTELTPEEYSELNRGIRYAKIYAELVNTFCHALDRDNMSDSAVTHLIEMYFAELISPAPGE